jgi:hypothetical protein
MACPAIAQESLLFGLIAPHQDAGPRVIDDYSPLRDADRLDGLEFRRYGVLDRRAAQLAE